MNSILRMRTAILSAVASLCMISGCSDVQSVALESNPLHIAAEMICRIEETVLQQENLVENKVLPDAEIAEKNEWNVSVPPYEFVPEADWQKAYLDLLEEVRQNGIGAEDYAECYCLLDIDRDEVPELIIRYGDCEAAYFGIIYTCRDGKSVELGNIDMTHTSLHVCLNDGTLIRQTRGGWREKVKVRDGKLLCGETDETDEVILLQEFPLDLNLPLAVYEKQRRGLNGEKADTAADADNAAVKEKLLDVLLHNGMVYGVGSGHFGNTGYIGFAEYCGPGITCFSKFPMLIEGYTWVDMNEDGQSECVLSLTEDEDPSGECLHRERTYVVLSLEGDVVYAYCLYGAAARECLLYEDGTFYAGDEYYVHSFRIAFDRNECCCYSVRLDNNAGKAVWIEPESMMQPNK